MAGISALGRKQKERQGRAHIAHTGRAPPNAVCPTLNAELCCRRVNGRATEGLSWATNPRCLSVWSSFFPYIYGPRADAASFFAVEAARNDGKNALGYSVEYDLCVGDGLDSEVCARRVLHCEKRDEVKHGGIGSYSDLDRRL